MEKAIAIITARGGSKRIPGKNIKNFCGKPIIAYSIEAALKSGLFSEVMVSTDSQKIAQIAQEYGASVPFMRSAKTADDYATTSDVIMEVMDNYKKLGRTFEYICCIYPTAPFVTAQKLIAAQTIMEEKHPVMVMPMTAFSYPPQRCYVMNDDGFMGYKYPQYSRTRSQDLENMRLSIIIPVYNAEKYLALHGQVNEGVMPIIVSELEVQDIDNEDDWKIAELKYQLMASR